MFQEGRRPGVVWASSSDGALELPSPLCHQDKPQVGVTEWKWMMLFPSAWLSSALGGWTLPGQAPTPPGPVQPALSPGVPTLHPGEGLSLTLASLPGGAVLGCGPVRPRTWTCGIKVLFPRLCSRSYSPSGCHAGAYALGSLSPLSPCWGSVRHPRPPAHVASLPRGCPAPPQGRH